MLPMHLPLFPTLVLADYHRMPSDPSLSSLPEFTVPSGPTLLLCRPSHLHPACHSSSAPSQPQKGFSFECESAISLPQCLQVLHLSSTPQPAHASYKIKSNAFVWTALKAKFYSHLSSRAGECHPTLPDPVCYSWLLCLSIWYQESMTPSPPDTSSSWFLWLL